MEHHPRYVSMNVGPRRVITPTAEVASVLDLAVRTFPEGADIPTVSLVGAWSCTGSSLDAVSWFRSKAPILNLHHGRDLFGDLSADPALLYAHVLAAEALLFTSTSFSSIAARQVLAPATAPFKPPAPPAPSAKKPVEPVDPLAHFPSIHVDKDGKLVMRVDGPLPPLLTRSALERLAILRAETARPVPSMYVHYKAPAEPPPPVVPPPVEASPDEPWAEAFDFGRLVPVENREIGGKVQPTVSARDVHTFLESGRDFTTWAKQQIERCSLMEAVDLQKTNLTKSGEVSRRGPAGTDYVVTLSAAKKIAMAASGSRGAAVREYFIECERRLLEGEPPIPGSVGSIPVESPEPGSGPVPDPAPAPAPDPALAHLRNWPSPFDLSRSAQPSMPDRAIPLTMQEFLRLVGFDRKSARTLGTIEAANLRFEMMRDGDGVCVGPHPVTGAILFSRPALDAWWSTVRHRFLPKSPLPPPGFE